MNYKVKGYANTWTVIDTFRGYALLENNTFGDETCYLLVKMDDNVEELEYTVNGEKVILPTVMRVIDETYDDIFTALEDADIIRI